MLMAAITVSPPALYAQVGTMLPCEEPVMACEAPDQPPLPPSLDAPSPSIGDLDEQGASLLLVRTHVACLDAVRLTGGKVMRALLKINPEVLEYETVPDRLCEARHG
jgi:hypothetical protein